MLGTAAVIGAVTLPKAAGSPVIIGMDVATQPDRTARWIVESIPYKDGWFYHFWVDPKHPTTINYVDTDVPVFEEWFKTNG